MAVALLVAAGGGERLGAGRPKAFVMVAGRPMLEWSLAALRAAGIEQVVIAVPPPVVTPDGEVEEALAAVMPLPAAVRSVHGGATRSHSVRAALSAAPSGHDRVVVHDAARPLVSPELIARTLAALDDADCAVAAARVTDTIKEAGSDGIVVRTLDRRRLWAIQTPQAFRRRALEAALDVPDDVLAAATDDVSEMPKNWNRRFKHNRDKIKTGDIYELAEVVRNLAVREQDKGLSTGEKQMYTRAKKILASEMMYALDKTEDESEAYLDDLLSRTDAQLLASAAAMAAMSSDE